MMELLQVFIKLEQFPVCLEPPGEVPATLLGCLGQQLRVLRLQSNSSCVELSIFTNY